MKRLVYFLAATVLVSIAAISCHICSSNDTGSQFTGTGEVALDLRALPAGLSLRLDYQRPFKIQTLPRLRLARSTPIQSSKVPGKASTPS